MKHCRLTVVSPGLLLFNFLKTTLTTGDNKDNENKVSKVLRKGGENKLVNMSICQYAPPPHHAHTRETMV